LQRAGLTLGAVAPKLDPAGRIASQLPEAGVLRRRGTPVSVVLAAAKPKKPAKKQGAPSKAAGGGVPSVAGAGAAAAAAALAKAGLVAVPSLRISTAKKGTVLATVPGKGAPPAPGGTVQVVESAGFPELAYDADGVARVVAGATGKRTGAIRPKRPDPAVTLASGGAWSPDGRQLAYAEAGRIYVRAPRARARTRVLLGGS